MLAAILLQKQKYEKEKGMKAERHVKTPLVKSQKI